VLWAAELETGLTAGWLGLPTVGADSWLAVSPLWWDRPAVDDTVTTAPDVAKHALSGELPVPSLKLKPRRGASSS